MYINSTTNGLWSAPTLIDTREIGETIEMTFIETSLITLAVYPPPPPSRRVFKIVYSCIEGIWNKSEKVYGEILPPINEQYKF